MHLSRHRLIGRVLALLAVMMLLTPARSSNVYAVLTDPVTAAWEKARAAGGYHFTSDITQITIPLATLTNVGRTSRTEKLYLEGQNDLADEKLEMTLWSEGGSVLQAESGLNIRTEAGKTFARRGASEWTEIDDFTGTLAPQGDFLSYLAAIKDVQAQLSEARNGVSFTRYTFAIDSPRFAAYMHQQMEAAMRARGELPPDLHLEVPVYFQTMIGSGELWVGEDGLPLRQVLTLQFPAQQDEQVHAQIVVDFSDFGQGVHVAVAAPQGWLGWIGQFSLPPTTVGLLYALPLLGGVLLLLIYRRKQLLNVAVVSLVIFAQVAGPVLSTITNVRFIDGQSAKAAVQEERQAAAKDERALRDALGNVEFDPHLNPVESQAGDTRESGASEDLEMRGTTVESTLESAVASRQAAPLAQTTDTDGDGLTDFVEIRLGTSEANTDTDSDGLPDNIEVNGFSFGGQTWYLNPDNVDSNGDGIVDPIEWGFNTDGTRRSTPLDTDGDGFPNLFDADNDNDGVPDNKDLSFDAKGASAYSEAAPLQLTLNNLTADKPTFVEFQLRPQDEKQLWYAFNVLDWPQDDQGQVRDIDGITYADYASTQGRAAEVNEANGDLKVVPMLEIRVPDNGANLPSQADLTPFNISVNNFTSDGATKVAYVPLSIVTDEKTGQRVAFSGQMRYQPTGAWPSAHQVRLAWVVQALIDMPCDKAVDTSADCQADGYRNNMPQMIQSYYGGWTLSGLTVREEHGTDMAVVYEDPAADPNKKDDAALWALSYALDGQFILARDADTNGVRDLKLADFPARFDRDNNPSAAQRMEVPNYLQVVANSYPTVDQATAFTAMTETVKILNEQFAAPVTSDRAIKPLLLFAQENRSRQLGLSFADVSNAFVAQSGASLTLNMAPSGQPARPVGVTAGLKWMAYCAPASGSVSFAPCPDDDYWTVLESRYANLAPLPSDDDPQWVGGRLQLAQLYYTSLRTGFYEGVQEGTTVLSAPYSLQNEADTATDIRSNLLDISTVPALAAQHLYRLVPNYRSVPQALDAILNGATALRELIGETQAQFNRYQAAQNVSGGVFEGQNVYQDSITRLKNQMKAEVNALRNFKLARVGAGGAAFGALFQILSAVPALPTEARSVFGAFALALSITFNVITPIVGLVRNANAAGASLLKLTSTLMRAQVGLKVGATIGAVIGVAITWGFFIYAAVTNGLIAGSAELNRAAFEAIAGTVIIVLLAVLSANPIGAIIAAILGVIDLLLTIICEAGVDALRQVRGLGGACFTLTTAATKYLLYLIYNYDLMVDVGRTDLMVTGAPDVTLADPSKGYVAGNTLSVAMPITTTLVHKDPDPANGVLINGYLWLFSPANIRRNTFKYSLTQNGPQTPPTALDQMPNEWQNIVEDHKYVLSPMYRGQAFTDQALPAYTPTAGLNQMVNFHINQGYSATAYECWMMWIPGTPIFFPVCYEREFKGENHVPVNSLVYDIFPASIDGFMAQTSAGSNTFRLGWDTRFTALADGDGDGLRSPADKGLDPDDSKADTDGDGLSDRFELEQRAAGYALSPILRDSDSDGLTDRQELELGSDPGVADSDNDGLADGVEVRHLVYNASGQATTTWAGGWQVTINSSPALTVWVSSNPLSADSDNDGISDMAERALAASATPANRLDSAGVPYHPTVVNKPPLTVLTDSNVLFGYVAPGQSLRYTTTVIANQAVAPGVLNLTVPSVLGSAPVGQPLNFNPSASVPQTLTQASGFTVNAGATTAVIALTSTVTTRLASTGAVGWTFEDVTPETGVGSFTSPTLARGTTVAANRADRQDGFRMAAKIAESADTLSKGDVFNVDLLTGNSALLDNDDNRIMQRGATDPDMACNTAGDCLVAWDEAELLGNGVVTEKAYRNGSGLFNGFQGDMASATDTLLPIDFNGDGKDDILYYRRGASTVGIYLSNGDGSLVYHSLNNGGTPANGFLGDVTSEARDLLVPVDINGDAYDDILFYRPGGGAAGVFITNSNGTVTYLGYRSGGSSINGFLGDLSSAVDSLQPMDVNGDGKDDLLYYRPGGGDAGVYIASSSGNGHLTYLPYRDSAGLHSGFVSDMLNGYDRLVPLDSNGDGKDDIYYARPGGNFAGVYLADTTGNGQLTYVPYVSAGATLNGWYPDMSSPYDISIPLDVNGDDKDDIFFARVGSGFAGVHLSNGDGTVTYVPYRDGNTNVPSNGWAADVLNFEDRFVPMDQNGDGKDDILYYRRGGQYAGIHLANPQGDGSLTYVTYRTPTSYANGFGGDVASTLDDAVPIDLNGDQREDFLWLRPGGNSAAAYLAVLNTPSYRIGGAFVAADGTFLGNFSFPRRNPAPLQYAALDRHPQVASNGDGFLLSYETVAPSLNNTHYVVLEGIDRVGNSVGTNLLNVGDVPRGDDRSLDNDLIWMGDRYRLSMKGRSLANIFVSDFNPNASTLTSFTQLASDGLIATGTSKIDTTPSLAWDPVTGRWALTYIRGGENAPTTVQLNRYPSVASTTADANTTFSSAYERVNLVWHPQSRGWLFSGQLTDNRQVFATLTTNLSGLTGDLATSTRIGWTAADVPSSALACPLVSSLPVLDLRFEELPNATVFADSSGFGNNAVCGSATQCPTAAVAGAPNAPLSDYALSFDGNQYLRVADSTAFDYDATESFTWMGWIKTNSSSPILRKGIGGSSDLMLSINGSGQLQMGFGNVISNILYGGPNLRDNQWHHVAVVLNRTTGSATLYTDGVSRGSGNFAGNFTTADDLFIGSGNTGGYVGQLDHLQFFNTALDATTIQSIYNRTQQSYCVATSASNGSANNTIQWARLRVTQTDTRGGLISASGGLKLIIDSNLPTASITSVPNNDNVGPGLVIAGTASDTTSGIASVEISINNGAWQLAEGSNTWTFSLAGQSGVISLRARAIDLVGNVGNPSAALNLTIDATPPSVTINPVTTTVKPSKNANGQWQVALSGTATDAGGAIKPDSVLVELQPQAANGVRLTQQAATLNGNNWTSTYLLDASYTDPTGAYTVTITGEDNVGNRATPATTVVRLDATGPTASYNAADAVRTVITQTITIGGVVSDTNSIAGIDKLEIAFTPVEQIAALPAGLTSDQAEAQLNRTWTPVTLAQRGAGVATTNWSFAIPPGLENIYQIDLRGADMLGNVLITAELWRGMIDTTDPRVVMTAVTSPASYTDRTSGRRHRTAYVCAAVDRNLDEQTFVCPGQAVAEPVRSFTTIPALQTLFPDLALRTGLAISYTLWTKNPAPPATVRACDSFGRCATASAPAAGASQRSTVAAVATTPSAVVVAPTEGSFVGAADGKISVVVAAEAASGLKEVKLFLDNQPINTATFDQAANVQTNQATIEVTVGSEGTHTLTALATDWANVTQTIDYPVQFTLDKNLPMVSIATVEVSPAETWALGSGILRFNGTANDSVALAAVQLKVGNRAFIDAKFAGGQWQIAYPVPDPEGQNLTVVARAIDRAGQTSEVTKTVPVDFTVATPPNTSLTSGPANPTGDLTATFVFTGTGGTNPLATFECRLDTGAYEPCASPFTLADLSAGAHTLLVRAIDSEGYVDSTPASYTWAVNAAAPTISSSPAATTTARTARFEFSGGSGFQCSLDGLAFAACTSPQIYTDLADGEHSFQVRAGNGAATRFVWTVTNAAPVASGQTLTTTAETPLPITLTASDEDLLTWQIVEPPLHGVLLGTAPILTYEPDSDYTGSDSFTFRTNDRQAASNVATVSINIQGNSAVNRAPLAQDDGLPATAELVARGLITLTTLLNNDSDPDDATPADGTCTGCTIVAVGQGQHGTVTLLNGATVTYVATDRTFVGTDTFTYTVSDNDAHGALLDTAQVAVTVQATATPGDCNASGLIDAGDLTAIGLEIFDGDGSAWYNADRGSFAFSGYGCDANADSKIDAGDLTCTARKIFDNAFVCSVTSAAAAGPAMLAVGNELRATPGQSVAIPIVLTTAGHATAAAAFSLHFDATQLNFDARDDNQDGLPDGVSLSVPAGVLGTVQYDAVQSRLNVVILNIAPPFVLLPDGPLAMVTLTVKPETSVSETAIKLDTASLGSDQGQAIPLTVTDGIVQIGAVEAGPQSLYLFLPLITADTP